MKREITCHCGENVETDFPEEIDTDTRPETLEEIVEGTFMSVTCPACGSVLKPEYTVHLFDSGGKMDITMIPELDRTRYLTGKLPLQSERVVIGFPELREKVLALTHGLDDRAVEILKFLLLEKVEDPDTATIILADIPEEGQLEFHIRGVKEEVGVSRVPMELYNRIHSSLESRVREEPFDQITAGQYVSIHKISIEDEEQ